MIRKKRLANALVVAIINRMNIYAANPISSASTVLVAASLFLLP